MKNYCPQCGEEIVGKVLRYDGANCCELCFSRLTGSTAERPVGWLAAAAAGSRLQFLIVNGEAQIPTRQQIRAYVANRVAAVRAHAAAGGNPHHMALDHQDQLDEFIATIPEARRGEFLRVYTEEMAAATEAVKLEVAAKELREMQKAAGASRMAWLLLVLVPFVVLPMVIRDCS